MKYNEDFSNRNSFSEPCRQLAVCCVVYVSSEGEGEGEMSGGHAPSVALVSSEELF